MKKIWFIFIIFFFINLSNPLLSQSDMGFKGIGVKIGIVDPEDLDATIGFGTFLDLGTIIPNLNLELNLDYWSKSENSFGFFGVPTEGGFEASVSDLTVGGTTKYIFSTNSSKISPFVGGGLGLHFLRLKVKVPGFEIPEFQVPGFEESDTKTKIGLRFVGGLFINLSSQIEGLAEFRYWIIEDANTLAILAGIVFKIK